MPAGLNQQIDRLVSSQLNSGTGDASPGQSVSSGTGQSGYNGQIGARVALDSQTIRYSSTVGTLYGGIYQYVYMTYTTTQPALGKLVFWDNSASESTYQVNGDAKPAAAQPSLVAGVVINTTVVKGTYAWMCSGGRCSVLFTTTPGATTAGLPVSAAIGGDASTADNGATTTTAVIASTFGVSEATVTGAAASLVQLKPLILHI